MSGVYLDFGDDKLTSDPTRMTDAELNAAAAVEVMGAGWLERRIVLNDGKPGWSPATDIAAAFEVVERMERDFAWALRYTSSALYECTFRRWGEDDDEWTSAVTLCTTRERAICEAALAAVRSET